MTDRNDRDDRIKEDISERLTHHGEIDASQIEIDFAASGANGSKHHPPIFDGHFRCASLRGSFHAKGRFAGEGGLNARGQRQLRAISRQDHEPFTGDEERPRRQAIPEGHFRFRVGDLMGNHLLVRSVTPHVEHFRGSDWHRPGLRNRRWRNRQRSHGPNRLRFVGLGFDRLHVGIVTGYSR